MPSISTLNPPVLPLELVLRIMENLNPYEDKSTFCSLSLVGRSYRSAAQRRLFYAVDFAFFFFPNPIELYWVYDHKRDTEITPAKRFLRSIKMDPSLAQAVKHFRIALHLRYGSNFQSPAYMHSNALTEILDALPCLQSLEVDSLSYLGWYWFKGQAKRSIEGKLRSSPSIRRVVLKGITALPPFLLCYANNLHTLVLSSTLTEEDRISESIHQYRPGQFTSLRDLTIAWKEHDPVSGQNSPEGSGGVTFDHGPAWDDSTSGAQPKDLLNVYAFFTSGKCYISLASLTNLSLSTWTAHPSHIQSMISLCSKTLHDLSFLAPVCCQYHDDADHYPIAELDMIDLSSLTNLSRIRITARFHWQSSLPAIVRGPVHHYSPISWLGTVIKTLPDKVTGTPIRIELRLAFEASFISVKLPWSRIVEPLLSRTHSGLDHTSVKLKCVRYRDKASKLAWLHWVESLKKDRAALQPIESSVVADNFIELDTDVEWREQVIRDLVL